MSEIIESIPQWIRETGDGQLWLEQIRKAQKVSTVDAAYGRFVSRSADDIPIAPIYPLVRDEAGPLLAETAAGCAISIRLDAPDTAAIEAELNNNVAAQEDAITLVSANSPGAFGWGLNAATTSDALAALAGLVARKTGRLTLDGFGSTAAMTAFGAAKKINDDLICTYRIDPFEQSAPDPIGNSVLPRSIILEFDGRAWHNAGATAAQELAFAFSQLLQLLRTYGESAAPSAFSNLQLSVLLGADSDQFETIAKFRAARILWRMIAKHCDCELPDLRISAETSYRSMTREGSWNNVLRATIGASAALIGGCSEVTVLPHTMPLGLPDAAARRLAQNMGHILRDESRLGDVADPSAGSGLSDDYSMSLSKRAWSLFQMIETQGGYQGTLAGNFFDQQISSSNASRLASIHEVEKKKVGATFHRFAQENAATIPQDHSPIRIDPDGRFRPIRDTEEIELIQSEMMDLENRNVTVLSVGDETQDKAVANRLVSLLDAISLQPTNIRNIEKLNETSADLVLFAGSTETLADQSGELENAAKQNGSRHVLIGDRAHADMPVLDILSTPLDGVRIIADMKKAMR